MCSQGMGKRYQGGVATGMSHLIVDVLEEINIEQGNTNGLRLGLRQAYVQLGFFLKGSPVQKVG